MSAVPVAVVVARAGRAVLASGNIALQVRMPSLYSRVYYGNMNSCAFIYFSFRVDAINSCRERLHCLSRDFISGYIAAAIASGGSCISRFLAYFRLDRYNSILADKRNTRIALHGDFLFLTHARSKSTQSKAIGREPSIHSADQFFFG